MVKITNSNISPAKAIPDLCEHVKGIKIISHQCDICEKYFSSANALDQHRLIVHFETEKETQSILDSKETTENDLEKCNSSNGNFVRRILKTKDTLATMSFQSIEKFQKE